MLRRLGLPGLLRVATIVSLGLSLRVGLHGTHSRHRAAGARRVARRGCVEPAQEQHCLAGAAQPVWTASLASDLKALQARASQAAAAGTSADARRWRELARKAEALEARTTAKARTGAELFQSQQIGLDCLDRFSAEREAPRASLEIAMADPSGYGESLSEAREHGSARLRQDLVRLQERSRALSARWNITQTDAGAGA